VSFQHELDLYEFCAPELRSALEGPRAAYKAHQDLLIQRSKDEKNAKAAAAKQSSEVCLVYAGYMCECVLVVLVLV
jgi:hypothetical protein